METGECRRAQTDYSVMCGRLVVYNPRTEESLHLLGHEIPPNLNAAPSESLPIIRNDPETNERELSIARWGILPFSGERPQKDQAVF